MLRQLLFALLLYICSFSKAEFFSATSELEPLLDTHKKVIDDLHSYIQKGETRLKTLKRYLKLYQHEHEKAMEDVPNYLGNPINAFTLIKSLTVDLVFIAEICKDQNVTMYHGDLKYPTSEDLTGAAQALTRLLETYRLNVHELSEGMLISDANSTRMSASDCYVVGLELYKEKDFINALVWMTEAYRKFRGKEGDYFFKKIEILEYIAFSHFSLGDLKPALDWTYKILKLDPNHARALENLPLFKKAMKEKEVEKKQEKQGVIKYPKQDLVDEVEWVEEQDGIYPYDRELHNYGALCRGEIEVSPEISEKLKCWYTSEHHPFLKYAPIKVEQMYIKPDIFLFHEVLSDYEIETIKSLAKPKLERALFFNRQVGAPTKGNERISKYSWLADVDSPVVARLSQRVADMTGLELKTAEELQVLNYGIGGYYEAHFDFTLKKANVEYLRGERVATVLFYMSDVAQGGATVFTELGLSLFPIKGTAAYWLNLHPSGEGDKATRHAACPVLRGSKWVCNKWILQEGQELIKPCNLEYQTEGINRKLPRPVPRKTRQSIYPTAKNARTDHSYN